MELPQQQSLGHNLSRRLVCAVPVVGRSSNSYAALLLLPWVTASDVRNGSDAAGVAALLGMDGLMALTEIPQLCSPKFPTCEVWST